MDRPTKNRLKRSSFLHETRRLAREHQANTPSALPLNTTDLLPQPWNNNYKKFQISTAVPQVIPGETQVDVVKRTLTLAMIAEQYPAESWIQVYTDGSATNAVADGGAGVHIKTPEGHTITAGIPTGKHCTNYTAEVAALLHAAALVCDVQSDCSQVVFLSDAKSVLEALAGDKLPHLMEKLQDVSMHRRVALQWVPAHCGVPGNEAADELAREGAKGRQPENDISFREKKALVKAAFRTTTTRDAYHLLNRPQQVMIFRLRTGHCRLNAHLSGKMRLVPSPICSCGLEDQTPEHILQTCPLFQKQREEVWPAAVPLRTKLYGCRRDLEDTTKFVSLTGLTL